MHSKSSAGGESRVSSTSLRSFDVLLSYGVAPKVEGWNAASPEVVCVVEGEGESFRIIAYKADTSCCGRRTELEELARLVVEGMQGLYTRFAHSSKDGTRWTTSLAGQSTVWFNTSPRQTPFSLLSGASVSTCRPRPSPAK